MTEKLYRPSQAILAARATLFAKVETHDDDDPESADSLWLESTPDDAFSEGEVLSIAPATSDQSLWFATMDSAYRFGGWPTYWSMTGTDDEVIASVLSALASTNQTLLENSAKS